MLLGEDLRDTSRYNFTQKNNVPETFLKKILNKIFYETCGNTSATIACFMMALEIQGLHPVKDDRWQCQPEDYLFLYLNDSNNYKQFLKDRPNLDPKNYPGNRVPQYYPEAIKQVFKMDAIFTWSAGKEYWIKEIRAKNVVQICLEKPGHYRVLHNYDTETDEFIYADPLYGFYKRIKAAEQVANNKGFSIVVYNQRYKK